MAEEETQAEEQESPKEEPPAAESDKEPITPNPEFLQEIIDAGGTTVNLCFQCGTCTGSCASGRHTAFRTRKVVRRAQLGLKEQILPSDDLWLCTTCYTCYERCPRGVEIPDIIFILRNMAVKAGYMAEAHKKVAGLLIKTGHMVPLSDEYKEKRKKFGLPEMPPTVLADKEAAEKFKKLIVKTGFDKLIAGEGGK
ncbi:MAG: CoB--CoM heterodisulfide reductase subunit C [Thermoplasmata archaeon]|nr:CoB--CoM heterodisulfide reductase subunit C [Thermoplasmata archaeon]